MATSNTTVGEQAAQQRLPEWSSDEWDKMDSDEFADKWLSKLEGEPAGVTTEEMDMVESWWEETRRNRRCALVLLTNSFVWLRNKTESDREFADAVAHINVVAPELQKQFEGLATLFGKVHAWTVGALVGREDMQELIEEATAALTNDDGGL